MCKSCESVGSTKCDCPKELITGGTQPTDAQQLKAEIAALITDIGVPNGNVRKGIGIREVIERLRQLSAI